MHPVLFRIGPVHIYAYGAMMGVAFLVGMAWIARAGKRRGINAVTAVDLTLWIMFCAILCARLAFVLLNLSAYRGQPLSALLFVQGALGIGGLSFHGGLAGAVIGSLLFCRRRRLSWLEVADLCAPAAALGYGFARIGCFLNGCCYGAPTTLPWGVRFLDEAGHWTAPSHPTQIYSMLGSWAIFGVLLWLRGRLHGRGQLWFAYLGLYGVLRFLVEILRRGYTAEPLFGWLTEGQAASIVLLAVSVVALVVLRPKGEPRSAQPTDVSTKH